MNRRQFLFGSVAGSAAAVSGCTGLLGEREDGDGPPRLAVDGRWLTDAAGNRVVLRGVSAVDPRWGTENADTRGKGYWDTLRLATDADAGWHARVLRVPVRPRSIEAVGLDAMVEDYLDRAVDLARERGVYLLLAYGAVERYDTQSIDDRIRTFWDRVAARYADETHVLFELFDEPTEPASDDVAAWRTWREHAEPWVSLVREQAPDTPVVVGSPRWSSLTRFAAAEPFEDDNVLYSAHVYPSWDPESWEGTFGTPALDVPVFVTEWGYVGDDESAGSHLVASTEDWGRPFRQWVDAHENVNWCGATFDAHELPNMFDYDWTVLDGDDHMGGLVKEWLADRRSDHQPAPDSTPATPAPTSSEPPGAPPAFRREFVGESTVGLRWDAATDPDGDDVLQYRVTVGDRETRVLRGSRRTIRITDLAPGEMYEASIVAVDEYGLVSREATARFTTTEPEPADATLARTATAPAVDGSVGDVWTSATVREMVPFWGTAGTDVAGSWRALWDEEALYVLASVTDADAHEGDFVELYLDLDHSRNLTYDGEDDLQLLVQRGDDEVQSGTHSAPAADGVAGAAAETDGGWRAVFAVPWAAYDVTPVTGSRMGLDVHAVEDTTGDGDRDAKVGWHDESDSAWETPRRFGTVELGE